MNFRIDPDGLLVAGFQGLGKGLGVVLVDEVDGAAAESATGETGTNEAGEILSEIDHGVGFDAAAFEIPAITDVCLVHELADGG